MPSAMVVVRILAVSYNIMGSAAAIFGPDQGVLDRHYGAMAASQGHGDTPDPSDFFVCVPE